MLDYQKLGLKAGLEIHQQIDTKKLFCSCPSSVRDDYPDIVIKRRLRASAGETGSIDIAAGYEMLKNKYFIYHAYSDTTCLVELDEEPIHGLNREALQAALQVSLLLKAKPVDRIEIMRKTVVDGSNTSGFQRTALIARNGILKTSGGDVRIPGVAIEEEAAKIAERTSEHDVYNLSRLGIPLVEIATEADIKSPEHAKEVAEKIGMILRSTGKVKRGLGTIRQDVNVSIEGGARIEIKGAQELKLIPKLVEYEALRQHNLIKVKDELKETGASVGKEIYDITKLFKNTKSDLIKGAIKNNGKILAIKLKNFRGKIGRELMPGRRVGKEFSEYAKEHAGVKGAVHTDELPKYDITLDEIGKINNELKCEKSDAFVLIADEQEKALRGLMAIQDRAKLLMLEIPKEVRKANPDGTTSFLRPMPGSARMYPETDAKPIIPDWKKIEVPELIEDRAERFRKSGVGKEIAAQLSKSQYSGLFEEFILEFRKVDASFIASTLLITPKEIKTRFGIEPRLNESDFREILSYLNSGKIPKEAVLGILLERSKGAKIRDIIGKYAVLSDKELEKEIREIIKQNKGMHVNALVGKAMEKLRGRAEGKKIVEILRKLME